MSILSESQYLLSLGKDQIWTLAATPECKEWLKEFARILQLISEGEGITQSSFSLFFCRPSETQDLQNFIRQGNQELISNEERQWTAVPLGQNRLIICQKHPLYIFEIKDTNRGLYSYQDMWYSLQPIYRRILDMGGLPVHGAVLAQDDQAILVAASGGTGKSTFSRNAAGSWRSISDDEAVILPSENGGFSIHPMPTWSDYLLQRNRKTWDIQTGYHLKGITFLKRAESEMEAVSPMGQGTASILMVQSASQVLQKRWQDSSTDITVERRKKIFRVASILVKKVPAFTLHVSKQSKIWNDLTATISNVHPTTEVHEESQPQK